MMSSTEWQDLVFNAGYNDALHGLEHHFSFSRPMHIGAMHEDYERGWTEGTQDK